MFPNVYKHAIQKFLYEILQDRYGKNQLIIDRIASSITIEQDTKDFISLITDTYELGFLRATDQYREQVEKLGFKIAVVPEKKA